MNLGRADIDTFDEYRRARPPGRGSLNVLALVKGGGMFRYRIQRDRLIQGRLRDAWVWSGGFLCGVLATGALAVAVVSFKVLS